MPMGNYVPNAASMFTAGACLPGSEGKPVWMGLTALAATACARVWGSTGSGGGASVILAMTASPYTTAGMYGPFISSCGIAVGDASGTGASIAIWMQK
jgi:hypothetical protein